MPASPMTGPACRHPSNPQVRCCLQLHCRVLHMPPTTIKPFLCWDPLIQGPESSLLHMCCSVCSCTGVCSLCLHGRHSAHKRILAEQSMVLSDSKACHHCLAGCLARQSSEGPQAC